MKLGTSTSSTVTLTLGPYRYAHRWRCSRLFLSDYVRTLKVDIDFTEIGTKNPVPVAFKFCADASGRRDSLYDSGVRAAITFDAVEALRALGVANRKVRPFMT